MGVLTFCHAKRVWFSGQYEMYGASMDHAHDCGHPFWKDALAWQREGDAGLRYLEVDIHRCPATGVSNIYNWKTEGCLQAAHLSENHLLTGFCGNGLSQKLSNLTAVKVINESPNTALAETSKALHEVHPCITF
jgi:hypothetical protein